MKLDLVLIIMGIMVSLYGWTVWYLFNKVDDIIIGTSKGTIIYMDSNLIKVRNHDNGKWHYDTLTKEEMDKINIRDEVTIYWRNEMIGSQDNYILTGIVYNQHNDK